MYDYFKQYEENKRERFISDGNPDVITIPQRHLDYLNMDMVASKLVNVYWPMNYRAKLLLTIV